MLPSAVLEQLKLIHREIEEDAHPIIVVSGSDIVEILIRHGVSSLDALDVWIKSVAPT